MWGGVDAADIARLNRVLVGVTKGFSPLSSCWPCCPPSSFWLLAFTVSSGAGGGSFGFLKVIMALTGWPAKTTGFSKVISTWTVEDSRLGNGININESVVDEETAHGKEKTVANTKNTWEKCSRDYPGKDVIENLYFLLLFLLWALPDI